MAKAQWMRDQVKAYLEAAGNGSTLSFVPMPTAMCPVILKAAAEVNKMCKPATCAVPKVPIVARGREAQDRHAVVAPLPPKLSARHAPATQDQCVRLQHHLARRGFVEEPVLGDGNCQFHALVDQLRHNGVDDGIDATSLRLKAVQWLEENAERLMDDGSTAGVTPRLHVSIGVVDWASYLADMYKDGGWGDEGTLLAVSALYHTEIEVISSVSEYCHIVHPPPTWGIKLNHRLHLGHHAELHYVSVRKSVVSAAPKPAELRTAAPPCAAGGDVGAADNGVVVCLTPKDAGLGERGSGHVVDRTSAQPTVPKLDFVPMAGAPGKRPAAPSAAQSNKKHKGAPKQGALAQGSMSITDWFKPVSAQQPSAQQPSAQRRFL
jgi:hypothetical protein